MGRPPCCEESGVKKGPWMPEEDEKLFNYISKHGSGNWKTVPKHAGLNRCGKSCRLRWTNYLRPDIKRGKFTEEEEKLIINLHSVLGNKWSKIATHLPGRTDNEIKNFWNTNLRKKLLQMGIDPETHKPRTDFKNLSQLLCMGMANNKNNLMSPWSQAALLGLQQPDLTQQLVQLQLLQNLLQLINGDSSFVNNMQSSLPLLDNHISFNNNPIELYASPALFPSAPSESGQDVSESWTDLEGASSDQQVSGTKNTSLSRITHDRSQVENLLPTFDSSTSFNQREVNVSPIITHEVATQPTTSSTIYDTDYWEKLLEDYDTNDAFWKELLDFTSTSESPISW
ncbi:hypothetical protein QN277_004457 [Acacia crassicarpa]|uniref:Uncharacterized protein n=1 Tax=Acacia crassicarpa TaxID=499986 RepID=A0AAE1J4E1_9FABA|nr:hypothetical protein QN277_004457 [Acacia crassicarpa]